MVVQTKRKPRFFIALLIRSLASVDAGTCPMPSQWFWIGAPSGSYRPAARSIEVSIPWDGEPKRVVIGNDQVVSRVDFDSLDSATSGWAIHQGSIIVRQPDSFGALRISIER